MELKKKTKVCQICGKRDFKNRKDNHHKIPRKNGGLEKGRVWLCTECHTMLHIAEHKGLCYLPTGNKDEYIMRNSRTAGLVSKTQEIEGW